MKPKVKPIHVIRMGSIRAAIWCNIGGTNNHRVYTVTTSRLYQLGDKWKVSYSFGKDHLHILAKVAERAQQWIITQPRFGLL